MALLSYGLALATEALFDVRFPGGQGYGIVIIVLSLGWSFLVMLAVSLYKYRKAGVESQESI